MFQLRMDFLRPGTVMHRSRFEAFRQYRLRRTCDKTAGDVPFLRAIGGPNDIVQLAMTL